MGNRYVPTTRPGHRLPHAWIEHNGKKVSTHDLVKLDRFLLITGTSHSQWRRAAEKASRDHGVPIDVVVIDDEAWCSVREIGEHGAILIRPDNHVAWRAMTSPANCETALADAIARIVGVPATL